jgi:PAS domain S-box-containing protein
MTAKLHLTNNPDSPPVMALPAAANAVLANIVAARARARALPRAGSGMPRNSAAGSQWNALTVGAVALASPLLKHLPQAPSDGDPGKSSMFQSVKPFIAVIAVILTGSLLVAAIFFTLLDLQWIAFLAGVLFSSILAMSAHATRAELAATDRAQRLTLAEYKLSKLTTHGDHLESELAAARQRLHYSDDALPAMLSFIDQNTHYLYHNRAFTKWAGLADDKIDGRHVRDVVGRKVFAEIEAYALEAASGRTVHYERMHTDRGGARHRMAVQLLPQFGGDGTFDGFYELMTDLSDRGEIAMPTGEPAAAAATRGIADNLRAVSAAADGARRDTDIAAITAKADEWQDASERILAAINGNEFALFCQHIAPLSRTTPGPEHYEVLIRLLEEESSMMPPGAFFALAEEHGLLPQLDRWVVTHVLDWLITPAGAATVHNGAIYFINVATATIGDAAFPEFVEHQLQRYGLPGGTLCFEIAEPDLAQHRNEVIAFARKIRQCGCLVAISGFGQNRLPAETLKLFQVDFLKIDGGIVRQIVTYPILLGRAVAICKLAKAIGVRTVAEMVEDEATLVMLRVLKVDFAQGFGISRPTKLTDIAPPSALVAAA